MRDAVVRELHLALPVDGFIRFDEEALCQEETKEDVCDL